MLPFNKGKSKYFYIFTFQLMYSFLIPLAGTPCICTLSPRQYFCWDKNSRLWKIRDGESTTLTRFLRAFAWFAYLRLYKIAKASTHLTWDQRFSKPLFVDYFLNCCHLLTLHEWSNNGYVLCFNCSLNALSVCFMSGLVTIRDPTTV